MKDNAFRLHIPVSPQSPHESRSPFLDPLSLLSWSLGQATLHWIILSSTGTEDEDADNDLRRFAVNSYIDLLEKPVLPDILIRVICWVSFQWTTLLLFKKFNSNHWQLSQRRNFTLNILKRNQGCVQTARSGPLRVPSAPGRLENLVLFCFVFFS